MNKGLVYIVAAHSSTYQWLLISSLFYNIMQKVNLGNQNKVCIV